MVWRLGAPSRSPQPTRSWAYAARWHKSGSFCQELLTDPFGRLDLSYHLAGDFAETTLKGERLEWKLTPGRGIEMGKTDETGSTNLSDLYEYFTGLMLFVVEQTNDFDLLSALQWRSRRRGDAEGTKRKLELFIEIAIPPAESLRFVVAVHSFRIRSWRALSIFDLGMVS
jgi:hypothetical protein